MSEANSQSNLIRSLTAFESNEPEQQRIAAIAASGGLPAHIVRTYASSTKSFQETFEKKEQIKGFRPGTPQYQKQATERIIKYLGLPKYGNYDFVWKIYRQSFSKWLSAEMVNLFKLLNEVTIPLPITEAADFLKCVCSHAAEYEVSPEDVTKLYDSHWIPRVEDLNSILQLCSIRDEAKLSKRKLSSISAEVSILRSELKTFETQVYEKMKELLSEREDSNDDAELASELKQEIAALAKELQANEALIAKVSTELKDDASRSYGGLSARLKAFEQALDRKSDTKALVTEIRKIAEDQKLRLSTTKNEVITTLEEKLSASVESLTADFEKKLNSIQKELAASKPAKTNPKLPPASGYRSPFVSLPAHDRKQNQIRDELDFVNSWRTYLERHFGVIASFEQVLAHHVLIAASNVIIFNDIRLVNSWLECCNWGGYALQLAASPLWASEFDWRDGLEYLASDQGASPKIVVINDYDIALPECYLAPSLVLWKLKREIDPLTKIFLISSKSGSAQKHQVLEHAPTVAIEDYSSKTGLQVDNIRIPNQLKSEIPVGVDPSDYAKWANPISDSTYNFQPIQQSMGIELTTAVSAAFSNVTGKAKTFFMEPSAVGLAMTNLILPWVKARYGESSYGSLGELLKQLEDVRC